MPTEAIEPPPIVPTMDPLGEPTLPVTIGTTGLMVVELDGTNGLGCIGVPVGRIGLIVGLPGLTVVPGPYPLPEPCPPPVPCPPPLPYPPPLPDPPPLPCPPPVPCPLP